YLLKELVLTALLERGQRNANLFLSGKPVIGKNEDFYTTKSDYETVLMLIDTNDAMYGSVQDRISFFDAMLKIQERRDMAIAKQALQELSLKYPEGAHIHQGLAMLYLAESNKERATIELRKANEIVKTWTKPKNTETHIEIMSGNLE
ncbi:MAG: hypothetical protein ACK45H_03950, partial [Bacteroidota bacterium]